MFYHSTNAEFTVFKPGNGILGRGIYFSDYSQGLYGKNIVQSYLTAKNPVRLSDLPKGSREINSAGFETRVIDDFFEKFPQYDAIVGRNEVVVKSPTQVKSATDNLGTFSKYDPDIRYSRKLVDKEKKKLHNTESIRSDKGRDTWDMRISRHGGDDAGDGRQTGRERLQVDSERDNGYLLSGDGRISDITDSGKKKSRLRHSLGIADSAAEQSLVAQNKAFRRIISEQQRVLNRHFVDAQKLKTLARVIKQDYRSTIDAAELTAMLGEAYTGIVNGKTISPDVVSTQMRAIAEKVISASKNLTEPSERSKEIIKDIRSVAVRLSEAQKREVAYHYGSYNDFRRSAFGSLRIRNDGIGLDSRYSELVKAYPEFFPADVAEPDQPMVLFEAVKALRNGYFDDNGFDYDSAVDYLAGIKDLTPGIRAPGVCFFAVH